MSNKLLSSYEDGAIFVAIQNSILQKGEHARLGRSMFKLKTLLS